MIFRILVISDLHYDPVGPEVQGNRNMQCWLGSELIRRAIDDANGRGGFDCIALLGDLVYDGRVSWAGEAWQRQKQELDRSAPGTPLLLVPGNEDVRGDTLLSVFGCRPGLRELGGYRFVSFVDTWDDELRSVRSEADRRLLRHLAATEGGPIVCLQHDFLHDVEIRHDQTGREYADAKVLLSLSGHYHDGHPVKKLGFVNYVTCPSLAEVPFRYLLVTLNDRDVAVEEHRLALEASPPVVDYHSHTEFAYGAEEDFTAANVIKRSRRFGLAGVCLTEHAPQLYCSKEEFLAARHIREPDSWPGNRHARMDQFLEVMRPLRSDYVRLGLEVEVDASGRLTLLDEHRDAFDTLVGSVHWLMEDSAGMDEHELIEAFLRTNECLLDQGVDILAHPLRFLARTLKEIPTEIYGALADMLSKTDTAAEINLHPPLPDPLFIRECVARGCRISLGSDAHSLREAGALCGHLRLLREATGRQDVADLLYQPCLQNAGT